MVQRMASEIDHLREQLKKEREANRENRRIITGLVQWVPELEPAKDSSSERPESPVMSSGETDKVSLAGAAGTLTAPLLVAVLRHPVVKKPRRRKQLVR